MDSEKGSTETILLTDLASNGTEKKINSENTDKTVSPITNLFTSDSKPINEIAPNPSNGIANNVSPADGVRFSFKYSLYSYLSIYKHSCLKNRTLGWKDSTCTEMAKQLLKE